MSDCYACGREVADTHVFCPYCGVDEPIKGDPVCPNCEMGVDEDWIRCPSCGESLQSKQEGVGALTPQSAPMGMNMPNPGPSPTPTFNQTPMGTQQVMMGQALYAMDGAFGRPAFAMSFGGALKTCFMDKFFTFSGRASRSEFWWCYLGMFILQNVVMGTWFGMLLLFDLMMGEVAAFIVCCIVRGLVLIALYIPYLAVSVRRLHDIGKSGWWMLLFFVPVGGIILLVWFITEGQPVTNMYGPVPTNIREQPITKVTIPYA